MSATWVKPFSKMTRAQAIELCEVLEEQRDKALDRLAAVRALHAGVPMDMYFDAPLICQECHRPGDPTSFYPCATIRALDGHRDTEQEEA